MLLDIFVDNQRWGPVGLHNRPRLTTTYDADPRQLKLWACPALAPFRFGFYAGPGESPLCGGIWRWG